MVQYEYNKIFIIKIIHLLKFGFYTFIVSTLAQSTV